MGTNRMWPHTLGHFCTEPTPTYKRLVRASLSLLNVFCTAHDPSLVHLYKPHLLFIHLSIYLLATPQGMWKLSSLIRDEMHASDMCRQLSLNHWTAREFLTILLKPNSHSSHLQLHFLATPTHLTTSFLTCLLRHLYLFYFVWEYKLFEGRMPSSFSVLSNTIVRRHQSIQKYLLLHLLTIYT